MKREVYKVVNRNTDGSLVSFNVEDEHWRLFYSTEYETVPNRDSLIFAFDTYEDALSFYETYKDPEEFTTEVWLAEAEVVESEMPSCMSISVSGCTIRKFWERMKSESLYGVADIGGLHQGTIFCEKIYRLINKIL